VCLSKLFLKICLNCGNIFSCGKSAFPLQSGKTCRLDKIIATGIGYMTALIECHELSAVDECSRVETIANTRWSLLSKCSGRCRPYSKFANCVNTTDFENLGQLNHFQCF